MGGGVVIGFSQKNIPWQWPLSRHVPRANGGTASFAAVVLVVSRGQQGL